MQRVNITVEEDAWRVFRKRCLDEDITASEAVRRAIQQVPWQHYQIVSRVSGEEGILCRHCGLVSWHPQDVRHQFCGKCNMFHADRPTLGKER